MNENRNHPAWAVGAGARRGGFARRFNQFTKDTEHWFQWDCGWVAENEKLVGKLPPHKRAEKMRQLK